MAKVLIVEDDVALCELLQTSLERHGHDVHIAGDRATATKAFAPGAFEVAVVDGHLPDGMGLDFIAEARAADPDIRLMFMSAHWRNAATMLEASASLELSAVLHKPFSVSEFVAHVDAAIDSRHAAEAQDAELSPFEAAMAELRADYAPKIAAQLVEFGEALAVAEADPSAERFNGMLHTAHRLHGTAGTYGFVRISAEMGMLEELLRSVCNNEVEADA